MHKDKEGLGICPVRQMWVLGYHVLFPNKRYKIPRALFFKYSLRLQPHWKAMCSYFFLSWDNERRVTESNCWECLVNRILITHLWHTKPQKSRLLMISRWMRFMVSVHLCLYTYMYAPIYMYINTYTNSVPNQEQNYFSYASWLL